ncbi:MAG: nucleotidyl transferase AbiEii/AbiGii toxin family protein [Pseudomonadota bacterium]
MKSILEEILINKIKELKKDSIHGQKILNLIKGDPLHLIILDFLFSHKIYKNCVMYGGSALKIIYNLPRMSVDLDFQIDFPFDYQSFEKEIIHYFKNKYGYNQLGVNASSSQEKDTSVIWITFSGLDKFEIPDVRFTKLKVRLDFNKFDTTSFQQILISKRSEYYNFNLRTYPISTLMASKIAAVLNRVNYCVSDDSGKALSANYKGRDIFDVIWYLKKGIIPNLKYLEKKGHEYRSYPSLFKKLKERLQDIGDGGKALKADLSHLYYRVEELNDWMDNWNKLFLDSLNNYFSIKIEKVIEVKVFQNFDTDNYTFKYYFNTDQDKRAVFRIDISEAYIEDFPISGYKRNDILLHIGSEIDSTKESTVIEYAGLFYSKIEDFLNQIDRISPRLKIRTKLIVYSHGEYDNDMIVSFANKELETCQFEDLL